VFDGVYPDSETYREPCPLINKALRLITLVPFSFGGYIGGYMKIAGLCVPKKIREVVDNVEVVTPLRKFLAINGRETIEYDFKAMHPRMLYNLKDKDYQDDPYLIGHNCSKQLRSIYKIVGMVCINSESEAKAIDSIQQELQEANLTKFLPDNTDATRRNLIKSFMRHNKNIQDYFFTGYGIWLQKIDSDIAHSILMYFARKGVLVL